VDLADAHGILVNVTAGMDLSIGEFQEVGSIVKQFASDDATVVVGTVIDPEMSDELRVTVVATGLNRSAQHRNRGEGFAAPEHDARIRWRRLQRHGDACTAVQPHARGANRGLQGALRKHVGPVGTTVAGEGRLP
jgi:cell division GTPase FtsZ